ncbi:MAG: hypothetical protein IPM86_11665 [Saprospiraceae bacterium]|nr:hypothetical protein [Saprospiraceae bacterium]
MKNILTFFYFFSAVVIFAQAPQKFNYQAVARNAQGAVLANQSIKIRASILDGSANGASQYSETHSTTSNQLGLFTLAIGGGSVMSGKFTDVTWSSGDKYLKIEMDATGGNNFTLMGTSQLLSVPYALNAGNGSQGKDTYTTWNGQQDGVFYENLVRIGPETNNISGPIGPYKLNVTGIDINSADLPVVFECKLDSMEIGDALYSQSSGRILRLERTSFLYPNTGYDIGINELGNMFISNGGTNNQTPPLSITAAGKIGIGTKDAAATLQVHDGDVYIDNNINGVIMKSPNGLCWRMTVGDTGQPVFTSITCPQ